MKFESSKVTYSAVERFFFFFIYFTSKSSDLITTLTYMLMNNFCPCLDWEFSKYGWQVIDLMEDDPVWRQDPMSRIFPKVTKCSMQK